MASIPQCRAAIDRVSDRIGKVDEGKRNEVIVERTVAMWIRDLGATFDMRLTLDGFADVRERSDPGGNRAQVNVTVGSDDLVALAEDRLDFGKAFLSGRVKVKASLPDMLRLRKLL